MNRREFIASTGFGALAFAGCATGKGQLGEGIRNVRAESPELQAQKRAALEALKELGPTMTDVEVRSKKASSGRCAAFFIDDVIFIFRDLAAQRPLSCWGHRFLGHLKEAHLKYGLKVQLNIFYRNDFYYGARGAEFTLADMPATWKSEFQEAKDWLKFGFHSYAEFPDYPWINASYDDVVWTWKKMEAEVERFAGPGLFAKAVTPHWGPMSKEGCVALKDCGATVVWASAGKRWAYDGNRSILPYGHGMRIENFRKPETAVFWRSGGGDDISVSACGYNHLDETLVEKTKGTYDWVFDRMTGVNFKKFTSGPVLNLYETKDIPAMFEETQDLPFNVFATHEEYFYKDYFAYQPDYCEKLFVACRWLKEHGYGYSFIEDSVD